MNNIKLMFKYTKMLNVLYVEDDAVLLKSTKKVLDNYFNKVDVAINGKNGLQMYEEYNKKNGSYYDLIITDINMPLMNGIDMSKEILDKNQMQSIIIITAYDEVEKLREAIDIGISGFIAKPIKLDKLNNIICRVSRAISDRAFVESHINNIEELNIKLEEQNKELKIKNEELDKSLRMLNTVIHKEQIINPQKDIKVTDVDAEAKEQKLEQLRLLIQDDLYELKEILSEIDVVIIKIINDVSLINSNSFDELILLFSRYASILSYYTIFEELSCAMADFSVTLKENPLIENEKKIKNVFMILESFMYVLNRWHIDLSSEEEEKINAFDASIISDMHTITNMWIQKKEEVNEGLDDIFDF